MISFQAKSCFGRYNAKDKDKHCRDSVRTEVAAATTQSTNHYTITARHCTAGEMPEIALLTLTNPFQLLCCCFVVGCAGTPDSLSHLPSVTPSQVCCSFHFPCVQSLSLHLLPEVIFALSLPPCFIPACLYFCFDKPSQALFLAPLAG